ncbi:hypothetical protein NL108_007773 [Boleophthalmus pectinirostris]|uniref:uncharacterized protein LOC110173687 n=1 Tax=Boleophthalmus pectinirostris TaxID=150288 RepID=UPI000A1C1AA8|nr:uncharacterized protein LOC110173687 [Boleophthalmus pectinirostris]KAJ0060269.1 hypothetical protein NL108_007773 [Boleophthalmus pectinirostris]
MEKSKTNRTGRGEDARPHSKQRPLSDMGLYSQSSHDHQWSTDFVQPSTSAVITVKKNKSQPEPPKRSISLPRPQTAIRSTSKCYSCPVFEITPQIVPPFPIITARPSAPLIQTSTITGPDPLGWKIRRKPGNESSQPRAGRLSLQIPLSDMYREREYQGRSNPNFLEYEGGKTSRHLRHNSDSLAFLRSSGTALPVTKEDLGTVELRPTNSTSFSVAAFGENVEKSEQMTKQPPPVPVKTEVAVQLAKLLAFSQEISNCSEYAPSRTMQMTNEEMCMQEEFEERR